MLDSIPILGWLLRKLARQRRPTSLSVSVTVNGDINDSVININVRNPGQRVDLESREFDVDLDAQPTEDH